MRKVKKEVFAPVRIMIHSEHNEIKPITLKTGIFGATIRVFSLYHNEDWWYFQSHVLL